MNHTPCNKSTSLGCKDRSIKITLRKLLNCVPSLWDIVKLNSLFTHFRRTCNPKSLKWLNELALEIKRRCSKNVGALLAVAYWISFQRGQRSLRVFDSVVSCQRTLILKGTLILKIGYCAISEHSVNSFDV